MLKSNIILLSEKNAELKKQARELSQKLQLAEQGKDQAQKQVLVTIKLLKIKLGSPTVKTFLR